MSLAAAPAPLAPLPPGIDTALLDAAGSALGLCVSGGGDSVALAVLMAELSPARLRILTVDHRLRPGSAGDTAFVVALGRHLGLPVDVLTPDGTPSGSVQAWARTARYQLFAQAAARHGLDAILTAHTVEDQAETVLLRLARGSGVRGLGAMRPVSERDGMRIVRPFLQVRRQDLRAALMERNIAWREDPSNEDARFDRVAIRRLAPQLAAVGLTAERLAETARHLARASEAVDHAAAALLSAARRDGAGALHLSRAALAGAPREVRLRALGTAVQMVGGKTMPPRFDALEAAERAALDGGGASLGRACLASDRAHVMLWREARGIAPLPLVPGASGVFDGRYRFGLRGSAPAVTVSAVGAQPVPGLAPDRVWRPALASAPGVFVEGALVAVPTLGVRIRQFARDALYWSYVR